MDILQITKLFSTQKKCIAFLEKLRWKGKPACPYCGSSHYSKAKFPFYHCISCNRQYCVRIGTIFHGTHLVLQKWFLAGAMIANAKKGISSLELSRQLKINQKTAWRISMQWRKAMKDKEEWSALFTKTVECDECYIGGKKKKGDKKKDDDDNFINPRGRGTTKQAVVGCIEREDGKVKAQKQDAFSFQALKEFLSKHADLTKATLYTDDFRGYKPFTKLMRHCVVNHSKGEFVNGRIHTNTIEGFWGLFKRGIVGSYHKLSAKHLDRYIQEFCWKYNNRTADNAFELLVKGGVFGS